MRCCRCDGSGYQESLDEMEQRQGIMDSCYHCGETGQCDCTAHQIVNAWEADAQWWREANAAQRAEYDCGFDDDDYREWDRNVGPGQSMDILEAWGPFWIARLTPYHEEAIDTNRQLELLGR